MYVCGWPKIFRRPKTNDDDDDDGDPRVIDDKKKTTINIGKKGERKRERERERNREKPGIFFSSFYSENEEKKA